MRLLTVNQKQKFIVIVLLPFYNLQFYFLNLKLNFENQFIYIFVKLNHIFHNKQLFKLFVYFYHLYIVFFLQN